MKKSILITGISGTGKTTISAELNKRGYKAYDMDDIPNLFSMIDKQTKKLIENHDNTDLEKVKKMDWICDKDKLQSIITEENSPIAFYCGDASNLDEIISLFETVVLLQTNHEKIRQRLTHRNDNDFAKTSEVQDWIMSWKDQLENKIKEGGALVIETSGDLEQIISEIIRKTE